MRVISTPTAPFGMVCIFHFYSVYNHIYSFSMQSSYSYSLKYCKNTELKNLNSFNNFSASAIGKGNTCNNNEQDNKDYNEINE